MPSVLDTLTKGAEVNETQLNQLATLVKAKTHRITVRVTVCAETPEAPTPFYDAPVQFARRFMAPTRVHLIQLLDVEHVTPGPTV